MNLLSILRRRIRSAAPAAATALLGLLPACHSADCNHCEGGHVGHGFGHGRLAGKFQDPCADIPKGALPQPNGSYVREGIYRMAAKAEMDDFYLYERHFIVDTAELAPDGMRTVKMIATRLPLVPYPVTIEDSGSDELNLSRRSIVIAKLLELGCVDAPKRVTIGDHQAEGLFGDEAPQAYQRLILGGNIFGGGFGGGGLGGFGGGLGGFGGGFGGFGGGFGGFGGGFGGGLGGLGGGGFGGLGY